MTLLVLAAALGVVAAGWVVVPVLSRRLAALGDPIPEGVLDADARKRVALASLREIEYDRIGGKLDDNDYNRLRAKLEQEAILAIQVADGARAAAVGAAAEFQVTHSCGFTNPPGSRYCSGCGRRLG